MQKKTEAKNDKEKKNHENTRHHMFEERRLSGRNCSVVYLNVCYI